MIESSYLVVAFPVDEGLRGALRPLTPEKKLPVIVPNSTKDRCDECGMLLWLGPRQKEKLDEDRTLKVMCPWCASILVADSGETPMIKSLGNPDSRLED